MKKDFYEKEYLLHNPTLGSEDVKTKFNNLLCVAEGKCPRLLDIGCGSGELGKRLGEALNSHLIVGVDISKNILKRAQEVAPSNLYVVADAAYLPFKDGSFDTAFTADILEHVPSPKGVLGEAGRVADSLFLSVPLESGLFSDSVFLIMGALRKLTNREIYGHIHRFAERGVDGLLRGADFIRVNKKVLRTSYTKYATFLGKLYSLLFNLVYKVARPLHQHLFGGYTYLGLYTRQMCPSCSSYEASEIERFASQTFGPMGHYVVARCKVCCLAYVSPMPREEETRRMYEKRYHEFAGMDYPSGEDRGKRLVEEREKVGLIEGFVGSGKVLDVGTGFGEFLEAAEGLKWEAVGVELNADIARYLQREKNFNVIQGTIEESGLEENSFDAINLDNVIEHTTDPKTMLMEAGKVLKAGGVVLVQVPNADWMVHRFVRAYYRLRKLVRVIEPFHHLYFFNKKSLLYLIEGRGLRAEKIFTKKSTQLKEFRGLKGHLYRGLLLLSSPFEKEILAVVARKPEDKK